MDLANVDIKFDLDTKEISTDTFSIRRGVFVIELIVMSMIYNNMNVRLAYRCDDMYTNEDFSKMMSYGVADGGALLSIQGKYDMVLYSSLLPVNKADKVSLEIYDHARTNKYFTAVFKITKKKYSMKVYGIFLNMRV